MLPSIARRAAVAGMSARVHMLSAASATAGSYNSNRGFHTTRAAMRAPPPPVHVELEHVNLGNGISGYQIGEPKAPGMHHASFVELCQCRCVRRCLRGLSGDALDQPLRVLTARPHVLWHSYHKERSIPRGDCLSWWARQGESST